MMASPSHDMPTPRPRSVKTSSSEQDSDDSNQQMHQLQAQVQAQAHSALSGQAADSSLDFYQASEDDSKSQSLTMESEIITSYDVNTPVPKPRSQIKHNESFKNLAAMAEQSDSISLRSLDITDEFSRTEEISTEYSIRSQQRDLCTTNTTISTTTTGTGTGSVSVSASDEQTESYDPTSETSVDDITQRSDVLDNKTTSFYIGESSKNIITKTTASKSVSDGKPEDQTLDSKDIQMLQELSVDSDESNDVFKEYITMKKDKDDDDDSSSRSKHSSEENKLMRQSSETRNDLLEESTSTPMKEKLLETKETEKYLEDDSMHIPIEKSEWESSEKEKIPESKPKVVHSPQELLEKTLSEVAESLVAAREDAKNLLENTLSSEVAPKDSSSLSSNELVADTEDISSFIGITDGDAKFSHKSPEPTKRSEGLFDSNIRESLNKEAAVAHYAQDIFVPESHEEPGSLGFISTGTAEDYSTTEEHAAKEEQVSLGFVSTETVEEFSSMEYSKDEEQAQDLGKTSSPEEIKSLDPVVHRIKSESSPESANRWSIPEIDNSSSSESNYKSYEKSQSRPLSSDVDNLMTQGTSSEYQTALDRSSAYRETTEYISAVSTLEGSSASMKSLDSRSETSASLGSIDVSELSETLVASSTEADVLEAEELARLRDLRKDDDDDNDNSEDSLEAEAPPFDLSDDQINQQQQQAHQSQMKRSQEMIFKPKEGVITEGIVTLDETEKKMESVQIEEYPKLKEVEKTWGLAYPVEEVRFDDIERSEDILLYHDEVRRSIDDSKLASSLDEGSILSVSMSSTSNIETVVENFEEMIGSAGSSSLTGIEGFGHITPSSSMPEEPFMMEMESKEHSPQDSQSSSPPNEGRKRGHKRHESTSLSSEALKNLQDKDSAGPAGAGGAAEPKESESESDTDPYESEYTRQFRIPNERKMKKKKQAAAEMDHGFEPEKRPFTPSQLVAEVIVEDSLTEELEAEALMEERRPSQNMQDYSNIPDIMVTEVTQKSPILEEESDQFQEKTLYKVKTQEELHKAKDEPLHQPSVSPIDEKEENFRKLVQEQYQQKLADLHRADDSDYDDRKAPDSPDSFEMVEQPDISDEFVIVEEVAKEANEVDLGGKSIKIKPMKYESKHDEEVEKIIIKSAPADPKLGSQIFRDDLNFEFEESPPTAGSSSEQQEESDSSDLASNNKRWVEMQLSDNQLRYPYDITGGVLEDIKEEDGEFEVGSSRISSFKDSFSSTPEYARRYYARGEHDDISLSSLQEFESLEQAISLENRNKTHQGSTDSSNGSFTRRYMVRHSGSGTAQGDDISISSLKEFEGLENACMEAHLIEIKAKEEAALLSRSDESNKSNGSSDGDNGAAPVATSNVVVTKVTRTVTRTEVAPSQQQNIEELLKQKLEECENDDIIVAHSDLPLGDMEIRSTKLESLESEKDSIDSMEISKSHDFMTSSIDSFDISKDATTRSEADSLEVDRKQPTREESIDSIENEQMDMMSKYVGPGGAAFGDGLTTTTTTTTTSTDADGHEHTVTRVITTTTTAFTSGGQQIELPSIERLPKDISEDSLNLCLEQTTSSAGTTATYQTSAGNSQMSGSVTSCASSTLMEDSFPTAGVSGSMTASTMSSSFWSHEESTVVDEKHPQHQSPKDN